MKQAAILIVDDNPEIREIIQILLTGEGFQVHEAANGTQALSQLKENIFDLIYNNDFKFFSYKIKLLKFSDFFPDLFL